MNIDPLCEFKNFKKVRSSKIHLDQPRNVKERSMIYSANSDKIMSIKNNKLHSEKYKITFYIGSINPETDDLNQDFSSKEDKGAIFRKSHFPKKYYFSQKGHSIQLRGEFFKVDPYTIEYVNCTDRKCSKKRKDYTNEWCSKCFGKIKSKDFRYLLVDSIYFYKIPKEAILSIQKITKEVEMDIFLMNNQKVKKNTI